MTQLSPASSVEISELVELVGPAKLKQFEISGGTPEQWLLLLSWNIQASGAVLETLATVEILVRQAMDSALSEWARSKSADHWSQLLDVDPQMRNTVARARKTASGNNANRAVDSLASHLPFGFWRYLITGRRHASLWVPVLHQAFPLGNADITKRRLEIARDLESLVTLRNRIAHHEPIFRRDLLMDFQTSLRISRAIHPSAGEWVKHLSRIPEIVKTRPGFAETL